MHYFVVRQPAFTDFIRETGCLPFALFPVVTTIIVLMSILMRYSIAYCNTFLIHNFSRETEEPYRFRTRTIMISAVSILHYDLYAGRMQFDRTVDR